MARQLVELFFQPPLAIARLGSSATPLESFVWGVSRDSHGDARTIIVPAPTLKVQDDGSLDAYLPEEIQFKDSVAAKNENGTKNERKEKEAVRPVAPFFELWARCAGQDGEPVTLRLLQELGITLESVRYRITVANRKAQRRCGAPSCAFIASAGAAASNFKVHELNASSPVCPGDVPLVTLDKPICLGAFQAIRPTNRRTTIGNTPIDFSALRVRFTPPAGEVYGPPNATTAPASPVPPGRSLDQSTYGGRFHRIVPKKNHILNAGTPWSDYRQDGPWPAGQGTSTDQPCITPTPGSQASAIQSPTGPNTPLQQDPQPGDSYDGANVGLEQSWGVVDDSCDGIIEAELVAGGQRFIARARVLSTCPDFAPDRRPFYSLMDDLADRDLPAGQIDVARRDVLADEVADLFRRAFETNAMINLDAIRGRSLNNNITEFGPIPPNPHGWPRVDEKSMTKTDQPFADIVPLLLPDDTGKTPAPGTSRIPLRFSPAIRAAHGKLSDKDILLDFLASRGDRVRALVRPPFGRFNQLLVAPRNPPEEGTEGQPRPANGFRDVRVDRDTMQDMRMPPFMRDSDATPLSVTHRQYHMIQRLIDLLAPSGAAVPQASAEPGNKE